MEEHTILISVNFEDEEEKRVEEIRESITRILMQFSKVTEVTHRVVKGYRNIEEME